MPTSLPGTRIVALSSWPFSSAFDLLDLVGRRGCSLLLVLLAGRRAASRRSGAQRPQHPAGDDGVAELDAVERPRAVEDAGQGVVVGRRDRVELVVVAAGAAERQAQERLADRVDLLVDDVHLAASACRARPAPSGPTTRKPVAISCSSRSACVVGGQQVAGDLLADEPVVRLVGLNASMT